MHYLLSWSSRAQSTTEQSKKSNQIVGAFYLFFFLTECHNSQLKQLLPRVAADWQGCYYVIWFSCRKWDNCTIPLLERNTYLWAKCFLKITLYNPLDFIMQMYLQLLINTNRARTLMRSFNEKLSADYLSKCAIIVPS